MNQAYWQAVLARNTQFDGRFVYGVRSTRVYCRPSCPSRRPRREQVEFFDAPQSAQAAGFRACKRCAPDGQTPAVALAARVSAYIQQHLEEPLTLAVLARETAASPSHLQRTFHRVMGVSPRQYADALRMDRFRTEVRAGGGVADSLYGAGFSSSSRLYERAAAQLGMTPSGYRKGAAAEIRYDVADCALGKVMVAATDRGICWVSLGDAAQELETGLASEFRGASLRRDRDGLGSWVTAIVNHIAGEPLPESLPGDVRATAFQRRVWEELRRIPAGETRSYGEVARAIGQPKAVRAVARACATNPVALLTPCHRVVREDGALAGYRWGIERKRRLLGRD